MTLLTRKRQVPIKQEATEGVAETLAAVDVLFGVEEPENTFTPEAQERNPSRATLSKEGLVMGKSSGGITGRTELKQRQTLEAVTTLPPCHLALLGSGHALAELKTADLTAPPSTPFTPGERIERNGGGGAEVYHVLTVGTVLTYALRSGDTDITDGEELVGQDSGSTATAATPANTADAGVAYHPVSEGVPSFTVADYMDGVANTLFGARATGSVGAGGSGQIGYLNFDWQGTALAPADAPLFIGTNVKDIIPETFLSAGVAVDGTEVCVDAFSLDFGNTLAERACANAATGITSFRITDRTPVVSIDPERELEAVIPFFTSFGAGARFGFEATIGQTTGLRTRVVAARAQYQELPNQDREGIATLGAQLRIGAASSDGDDDYFIAFY